MLTKIILTILLFLCVNASANAQFLSIELNIEPELSASLQKNIAFSSIPINYGLKKISLGDTDMGVFSIAGLADQQIMVHIKFPDFFKHQNPYINDVLAANLEAAYTNTGKDDFKEAESFKTGITAFKIFESDKKKKPSNASNWQSVYIYLFGTIEVGNVRGGVYEGMAELSIIYQ